MLSTGGAVTLGGLVLGGSTRWNNVGTATQTATTILGDASGTAGLITNFAGATYNIATDTGIATIAAGTGGFINQGLLEKTGGTGTSMIGVAIVNRGTIAVASGTLDLTGAITQTGTLAIQGGATLELDGSVVSLQTVAFSGSGGDLLLTNIGGFSGGISGFAAGETLDLTTFGFGAGEKLAFAENAANTQGVLTITDGALKTRLTLFGQYAAAGFQIGADSGGGTAITYVNSPSADLHLAASQG